MQKLIIRGSLKHNDCRVEVYQIFLAFTDSCLIWANWASEKRAKLVLFLDFFNEIKEFPMPTPIKIPHSYSKVKPPPPKRAVSPLVGTFAAPLVFENIANGLDQIEAPIEHAGQEFQRQTNDANERSCNKDWLSNGVCYRETCEVGSGTIVV